MSNHRPTLSKKLSRIIMILSIPLFVLSLGAFYRYANELIHKEAMERQSTILNSTVKLVENYLSTIETAANANAWMLEESFNPDSLQVISRRIVSLNKSVLSCSVSAEPDAFPEYGRYFSVYSINEGDTVISVLEPEFEYFEKNWYKKPMQTGHPCWINPFSDFNEGTINHHDAVGSYCIPLRPKGGRIRGVVSADFSFQQLRETVLATNHPYPSSYYMLLGPAGGYLIHPESSLLFKKSIFSATDSVEHPDIIQLGRAMTGGRTGTMHVTFDQEFCHVCYMPVHGTGWSIALVCHEEDVLKDYRHLTLVMIIIVIIGILLITWITRRVVQHNIGHLNELMKATKEIADGNYDTIIPVSDHKGVVGNLQNAFREMQLAIISHTKAIKETDTQIRHETTELESTLPRATKVAKRKQIFIQNVSRQINTPLNVINGLTSVLLADLSTKGSDDSIANDISRRADTNNFASTMKHNANLVYRITRMLYDSSDTVTANNQQYERNDVIACNAWAREMINISMSRYQIKEIRFSTEVPDELTLRTNRAYLELTIGELLMNASKYSDGYHIVFYISRDESTIRFTIEDIGPGLPKNSEELIFVPFSKVNDLSEGLGLGLPLCKRHISKLGGDLIYDPSYEQGCRFIVALKLD